MAFLKSTAPTDLGSQLDQALGPAPRRDQLRLCVAAYFFREWGLATEWGFISQADYARERLGESLSTYCDWAYAGRLFAHSAKCRAAFRSGALTLSALSLLGQRCTSPQAEGWLLTAEDVSVARLRELLRGSTSELLPPDASDASDACDADTDADTDAASDEVTTVALSFRLPQSAVRYCEETLELARAIAGAELATTDAIGVVLAEASTEISPADPAPRTVSPEFLPSLPSHRKRSRSLDKSARADESLRPLKSKERRRRARDLDHRMRRALQRLAQHRADAADLLLLAFETHWHHDHGFRNFYEFTRVRFGLRRTTAIERTQSARLRRLGHPIALARTEGRLGAVKA